MSVILRPGVQVSSWREAALQERRALYTSQWHREFFRLGLIASTTITGGRAVVVVVVV